MKKASHSSIFLSIFVMIIAVLSAGSASAHFGMIIPSDDIVSGGDKKQITLDIRFAHPFEGQMMDMEKPRRFGVIDQGRTIDLRDTLEKKVTAGLRSWAARYRIRRPGDKVFFVEPEPYWEPAEEKFIIHYTKVIVSALDLEIGWDREVGMKIEIVPLTRPYGLWAGNVFQGIVKLDGRPVPYAEIEVEYLNEGGRIRPPAPPYITQVIRADGRGVFTYAMPRSGWWGFAALKTADFTLKHEGKDYPVELGAVIWVRTREMK